MYKVNLTKTPKTTVTSAPKAPKAKPTPTVRNLAYGQVSAYTACKECGKRFTQKNTTTRFNALARHYYNGCD